MDTLKSASTQNVDFAAIEAAGEKWTDTSYPTNDAFYWKDVGEYTPEV